MSLENKLTNEPRRPRSSNLFNYALSVLLGVATACGGGGGGGGPKGPAPNPVPQNRAPVITSTLQNSAREGDNHFDQVNASDADGDTLTYSLVQGPNGMTINQSNGYLTWSDAKEGSHNVTVQVSDNKGGLATQSTTLTVANAFDDLSGKVNDILSGNPITNATDVMLGHRQIPGDQTSDFVADLTARTDTQGNYSFTRVPTGINRIVQLDNPNYLRHSAGSLTTNGDVNNLDFLLIPNTFNLNFYNEIARPNRGDPSKNFMTTRWLQVPQVYINTSPALGSGRLPTQQEIDLVETLIRNELSRFNNGFTTNNVIITRGTNPPSYGTLGSIRFEWDDSPGAPLGGASLYFNNGNELISSAVRVRTGLVTSQQLYVFLHELTHSMGADGHVTSNQSISNNPQTVDRYTLDDLASGRVLYSRLPGSRSPDDNSDSLRIR